MDLAPGGAAMAACTGTGMPAQGPGLAMRAIVNNQMEACSAQERLTGS
jgi:hypothetical protein